MPHTHKKTLFQIRRDLEKQYRAGVDIEKLVKDYTQAIDNVVLQLWPASAASLCLIAVGGYGRAELQPYSDVDLLIIAPHLLSPHHEQALSQFIANCWDVGLEIGHAIVPFTEITTLAANNLSFISSWMENRLLAGNTTDYQAFLKAIAPTAMWSSRDFFLAKQEEQRLRYEKYDGTSYNLEPNVKQGPGGLRDIHTISWVAKRHFGTSELSELVDKGFLTPAEFQQLKQGQHTLWRVAFALHFIQHRREWHLRFDHQHVLSKAFGYHDTPEKLGIELFMRDYFRTIKTLRQLNDMLLQLFREAILQEGEKNITPLHSPFQIHNHYLETIPDFDFKTQNTALFDLFLIIANRSEIKGVRASTIRRIQEFANEINDDFRSNPVNKATFIKILNENNVTAALTRMNSYGILAKYLPPFGEIVGQMQYDLYHSYTVDQHIIFTIRNIERFRELDYRNQFPVCAEIVSQLSRPCVLMISALFHDIAKGRGGNHSQLGEQDVKTFCLSHNIPTAETQLIAWLVKHHLLMSTTAQSQDIYDPDTIKRFARLMPDSHYLDHLYCLTVADICATNPALWNSWKNSLLTELYRATREQLICENKITDPNLSIQEKQKQVLSNLNKNDQQAIQAVWKTFPASYFLRESSASIAWHASMLLNETDSSLKVAIKQHNSQGATEIFLYCPAALPSFAITTTVLANLHLSIMEANLLLTTTQTSLATYIILDETENLMDNPLRQKAIEQAISHHLAQASPLPRLTIKRLPQHMRHFQIPVTIEFEDDIERNRTKMQLTCADRPGLLAIVSHVFLNCQIQLQSAKISTYGERAEDVFLLRTLAGSAITNPAERQHLKDQLEAVLCK